MKVGWQPRKWLEKKAKRGMRGFPVATIAFYGQDNQRASKVAVCIIRTEGSEPELRRWFSEAGDVRNDVTALAELTAFLRAESVHSVTMTDRIIGCRMRKASIIRMESVARSVPSGPDATAGPASSW